MGLVTGLVTGYFKKSTGFTVFLFNYFNNSDLLLIVLNFVLLVGQIKHREGVALGSGQL